MGDRVRAVCPGCGTEYLLEANLLGQSIRCPAPRCGKIFAVTEASPAPTSAHVEQMIPLLGAEPAPPPVLEQEALPPAAPEARSTTSPIAAAAPLAPHQRRRLVLILSALALLLIGGTILLLLPRPTTNEDEQFQRGQREYKAGRFDNAAAAFAAFLEDHPDDKRTDEARFMLELSRLRGDIYSGDEDFGAALDAIARFLTEHAQDPRLPRSDFDLGETFIKLMDDGLRQHRGWTSARVGQARAILAFLDEALPGAVMEGDRTRIRKALSAKSVEFQFAERRKHLLDKLDALAAAEDQGSIECIHQARRLIDAESREAPDLAGQREVQQRLDKLYQAHLAQVRYETAVPDLQPLLAVGACEGWPGLLPSSLMAWLVQDVPVEDSESSVLPAPLVAGSGSPANSGEPEGLVPVLARGMFHVLSTKTGALLWAMRVSVDARDLPLHVLATTAHPEMFLIIDPQTGRLRAVDAWSGRQLWQCTLGAPSLARAVVHDERAFVSTTNGYLHEIELGRGQRLGRYRIGQSLNVAGTLQPGSSLLYLAADEACVFLLDLEHHVCRSVLHTGHLKGTLRSEPMVVTYPAAPGDAKQPGGASGQLVFTFSEGLATTRLEAISLPQKPGAVRLEDMPGTAPLRLAGVCWSKPYCDGERLIVTTDEGVVAILGLPGPQGLEKGLFRLVPDYTQPAPARASAGPRLLHVEDNVLLLLTEGDLSRLDMVFDSKSGAKLVSRDVRNLQSLGTLLCEPQLAVVRQAGAIHTLVFAATQAMDVPTCRATAFEPQSGAVRWQRQLGVICAGDPSVLDDGKREMVVLADRGGAVFRFDAGKPGFGGQMIAPPLDAQVAGSPVLLRGRGEALLYQVATTRRSGDLPQLCMRYAKAERDGLVFSEWNKHEIAAPLAGPPAAGAKGILMPLADGSLLLLNPDGTAIKKGPTWRGIQAREGAPGFVNWLNDTDFLTTNGDRGLCRWHGDDDGWHAVPGGAGASQPTLELPAPLAAAPLVLGTGPDSAVCVALVDGTIHLVRGERFQTPAQKWDLGGMVTGGPIALGMNVACVIDRRIVCLNPAQAEKIWDIDVGAPILGVPQVLDDTQLLVTTATGKYLALDRITGKPLGSGYLLKSTVVPAAVAARLESRHILAPLSDGSLLRLPRELLK